MAQWCYRGKGLYEKPRWQTSNSKTIYSETSL